MPTNVVKSPEQERLWRKAKKRAAAEGHSGDWAYVMGIFKRMGGLSKALRLEDLDKAFSVEPLQPIHTGKIQPAWMRVPGAASMFGNRRLPTNPEQRYLSDLYTAKRMPKPNDGELQGGPYMSPYDVVRGLGFSANDEEIWATRVGDWVNRARVPLDLRKALHANLRDYPELDPYLRTELARRTLAYFTEKRRQAGDFIVKSDLNPPLILAKGGEYQNRQSTTGKKIIDRNATGVGRRPGRTVSPENAPGKGSPAGAPQKPPQAGPPGKGPPGNAPPGNGPPNGPPGQAGPPQPPQTNAEEARDTARNGDNGEDQMLDTSDLDGPEDPNHIKSKLEALVGDLHDLHEHMQPDDAHLVQMHNAIKDKMRDAYRNPSPQELAEVQHLIDHFREIVVGAPEEVEEDMNGQPPTMGNKPPAANGKPPAGPPQQMRKGLYLAWL